MIYRECGVFKTTYQADTAFYTTPLARYAMLGLGLLAVLVVPFLANDIWLSRINLVLLAALAALGLNLLTGYAGQISIGHAGFMAVGAYTAAILMSRYAMPFWVALPAGGVMATMVGTFFGIPSLRIKGFYLAIATLAAQFIIQWTINHVKWISGGTQASIYIPPPSLGGLVFKTQFEKYFLILAVVAIMTLFAMNLVRGRIGRAFMAVRDRDVAAEIIGVDVFRYKLLAFAVSSFYAGVAGVLYTLFLGIANYEQFTLEQSIAFIAMIIIGGLGSVTGSFLGAAFITLLPIFLSEVVPDIGSWFGGGVSNNLMAQLQLMIYGALIILFLILEPLGLARLWQKLQNYFRLWPFAY
jgi:branched-chain amino acid transport system permease protein